ncbi:MAG: fibro-slime domain-containing protein [Lachnospiraceae bacterium]|nr:fibro-slime domain-containing protein [Lachnospiraceae bacterium]
MEIQKHFRLPDSGSEDGKEDDDLNSKQRNLHQSTAWKKRHKKHLSGIISWILVCTVVISLFGGMSVHAEEPAGGEEPREELSEESREQSEEDSQEEVSKEPHEDLETDSQTDSQEMTGLCEHHSTHTTECNYMEAVQGTPCTHEHDATCGYRLSTEEFPCIHEHDEVCGFMPAVEGVPCDMGCEETSTEGALLHKEGCSFIPATEGIPCAHEHDTVCGYAAAVEGAPCMHVHDDVCGYQETAEGSPCTFICEICAAEEEHLVMEWTWVDEEGVLVYSDEAGLWALALPGAGEENPVDSEILLAMLPGQIEAVLEDGTQVPVPLEWDLSDFPAMGWSGDTASFRINAVLQKGYALGEDVPALSVLVELGEGQAYAVNKKYVNQWCYVADDGGDVTKDYIVPVVVTSLDRDRVIARLNQELPAQIRGWVYTKSSLADQKATINLLESMGFTYETTKEGKEADGTLYNIAIWGRVNIEWDLSQIPDSSALAYGVPVTVQARTVGNGADNIFYVNSNTVQGESTATPGSSILSITFTLVDARLSDHLSHSVDPDNVVVNLFDYWVEDYGKDPTPADGGDILQKSDYHFRPKNFDSPVDDVTDAGVGFSTVTDWNKGINEGHLLIFGDGITHAGLWNKGAGENTQYGRAYAGMEGIVRPVLVNGYPVINTANAREVMLGVTDPAAPDYRNHTLIRDYRLAGDHKGAVISNPAWDKDAMPYENEGGEGAIRNLSDTVIRLWEASTGQSLTDDSEESLDYLFDPSVTSAYKHSYVNVDGLFQLDDEGYYYYNMRENFAEFRASREATNTTPGEGSFILYDAPATVRTDGKASIGNFFPFNTGEEVFDGLDENGKLTSDVYCARNTMNHHLGMTVEIQFRQPIGGEISVGSKGRQPMTFEFSGDDDVWVFIDDVLVLDLGGTHSEIYGTIDFSTGEVCIGRAFGTNGIPENPKDPANLVTQTTLKALFEAAGQESNRDTTAWRGETFANNSDHTLRMFYLERGNYDSSIALRFNLQPLLYQQIKKVDQNGQPLEGVVFEMYPAKEQGGQYVQTQNTPLAILNTEADGTARFIKRNETDINGNPLPFDFAEHYGQDQTRYYILKETATPKGYRPLPVDVVLEYNPDTTMITVANRWVTGAFGSFTSTITGNTHITYGAFDPITGNINQSNDPVSQQVQETGLVVAIPMVRIGTTWKALYGGNVEGFHAVTPESRTVVDWRKAALNAVLHQSFAACVDTESDVGDWYLSWDEEIHRLTGLLSDLPGRADRYQLVSGMDADMKMVYAIIDPAVFTELLGMGSDLSDEEQYQALADYVKSFVPAGITSGEELEKGIRTAVENIYNVTQGVNGRGISFLNVDQFVRNFRSLVYIPNEQRELRVWKVDQDGRGINGVEFTLYGDPACQQKVASGTTGAVDGRDGVLVLAPYVEEGDGYAKMEWASDVNNGHTQYYLKETAVPADSDLKLNDTIVPVYVGIYSIYADAGKEGDGVTVMAGVGKLAKTMIQYAADEDVEITLRDITAIGQVQNSGSFDLHGWQDMKLNGTEVLRSMDLHYGRNALPRDYGLHDEDGGASVYPYFVTDTGFIRARVEQNHSALQNEEFAGAQNTSAKCENLGDTDLTSLFSLLNIVVVTDRPDTEPVRTGQLKVSKTVQAKSQTGDQLTDADYTQIYQFTLELTDKDGNPLGGNYPYYYYGEDKSGVISNYGKLYLHHDESVTIMGLPDGTNYKVTEEEVDPSYVIPPTGEQTGVIKAEGKEEVPFINTKEKIPEILQISKKVEGDNLTEADRRQEFEFMVTLTDAKWNPLRESYVYSYGNDLTAEDGKIEGGSGKIKLRDGECVTIRGLPVGAHYTVTESPAHGWNASTPNGGEIASGEIVKTDGINGTAEVAFTNHRLGPVGDLRVSKEMVGDRLTATDRATMFSFTITLLDADGNELTEKYPFYLNNGVVHIGNIGSGDVISLGDGDSMEIRNIPAGTHYVVTEMSVKGFHIVSPDSGISEGAIVEDEMAEAAFTNEKDANQPFVPTPDMGILRVNKIVTGEDITEADHTQLFAFTVTLTDKDGNEPEDSFRYYVDGSEDSAGEIVSGGTLFLHHDQYADIRELPAGMVYTVREMPVEGWIVISPDTGAATDGRIHGTITEGEIDKAVFVNYKDGQLSSSEAGVLRITKTVTGEGLTEADFTRSFSFIVTFTDAQGNGLTGSYPYYRNGSRSMAGEVANGGTLLLSHGESIVIGNLPEGTRYTVTETKREGWDITAPAGGTAVGTTGRDGVAEAGFVNTRRATAGEPQPPVNTDGPGGSGTSGDAPMTGDSTRVGLWMILTAVSLCGLCLWHLTNWRERKAVRALMRAADICGAQPGEAADTPEEKECNK